jgi:hypothetical protein
VKETKRREWFTGDDEVVCDGCVGYMIFSRGLRWGPRVGS